MLKEISKAGAYRRIVAPFQRCVRPLFAKSLGAQPIIHACHHKMGTYWLSRNLRDIAYMHGRSFGVYDQKNPKIWDFTVMDHGRYDHLPPGEARVTHMVRDPRDVAVSGYHYHLWTDEAWAHVKEDRWNGMSYQELLNSLPKEEGMALEIRNLKYTISELDSWPVEDARVMLLKFEDVLAEPDVWFKRVFEFYGFTPAAVARGLEIAQKRSLKNVLKSKENRRRPHARSSKSGEWEAELSEENQSLFNSLYGDTLKRLGYV